MIVVFVIGYACITVEHQLKVDKAAIALITGILCWTIYVFGKEEIVQLDFDKDPRANLELSLYEDRMARLMAVMIGIFDPDAIILGGGMSNIDRFYLNIPNLIPKYTFSNKVQTKVLKNIHGDSSGVRGAAWLWDN